MCPSERRGVSLGKALSHRFDVSVEIDEYRRMAEVEDDMWFYRALRAHIRRELVAICGTKEATMLDAGCGTGGLIRSLEASVSAWRWTGLDVEPLACTFARERCSASVVEGSLMALPFEAGTFDAVVCSDVLYHLDDDGKALRELFRVLRPGGSVVINVPAHQWLWSYHDVTVHGRRRYERRSLTALMQVAGFETVRASHWNLLPLPLVIVRRKLLPAPQSGSDVRLYPKPVEVVLNLAMQVERRWIASGRNFTIGSSILATATKPM
jgi:SAM-dependent methyltransferase